MVSFSISNYFQTSNPPQLRKGAIHIYIPLTLYPRRGSIGISVIPPRQQRFYQLATRYTADVTGGKPIAIFLQSILGVSAINPLVAFYDEYII
jgi:hypothetical protein